MSNTKCSVCNEDITGAFLTIDGEVFHNECFKCDGCCNALGTSFKVRGGKRLCDSCEPDIVCALCKESITGSILTDGDKSYHADCFKCEICAEKLDASGFFRKSGKVMCKACAESEKSEPKKTELPKVEEEKKAAEDAKMAEAVVTEKNSGTEKLAAEEPTAPVDLSNALTPRTDAALPSPPSEPGKGVVFNPPARVGNVKNCCVRLTIVSAKGLRAADLCGLSDPYCIVHVPETKITVKTKTKMMNLNPEWNQTFLLDSCTLDGVLLEFTLMDYDFGRTHDVLGQTELLAENLVDGKFEGDLEILYKAEAEGVTEICGTLQVKVSLER